MTYDQLDAIADAYIPLLVLVSITVLGLRIRSEDYRGARNTTIVLLLGITQTYAFMFLDQASKIWPHFDLDYSTHTSLALVFVVFLSFINRFFFVFALASMSLYGCLMLYQGYHSVLDMLTTGATVLPGLIYFNVCFNTADSQISTDFLVD